MKIEVASGLTPWKELKDFKVGDVVQYKHRTTDAPNLYLVTGPAPCTADKIPPQNVYIHLGTCHAYYLAALDTSKSWRLVEAKVVVEP